ncbi:MAG TPA: hypothetical protein VKE74_04665, partial [Gemmataceae bacterium]|nr:hypothetical protein [Gemmataceae bacterium]
MMAECSSPPPGFLAIDSFDFGFNRGPIPEWRPAYIDAMKLQVSKEQYAKLSGRLDDHGTLS